MKFMQKTNLVLDKFFEILGIKLLVILLSSVFLATGKLSEGNWVYVVLGVAGLRTLNQTAGIIKGSKVKGKEVPHGNN